MATNIFAISDELKAAIQYAVSFTISSLEDEANTHAATLELLNQAEELLAELAQLQGVTKDGTNE